MKKLIGILVCLFLIGNASIVMAETSNQGQKMNMNATMKEIVDLVTPYVTEVVKKENGENAKWTLENVSKLTINNDYTVKPTKRWYKVHMMIKISDPNKNQSHIDTIVLKVDPHADQENKAAIELIEYSHTHSEK